MFPWLFLWCPQWNFPLSGEVQQRFSPEVFFQSISPDAGNGQIEAEVVGTVASYGRQLGILADLVLWLADPQSLPEDEARHALSQLRALHQRVGAIKNRHNPLASLEAHAKRDMPNA